MSSSDDFRVVGQAKVIVGAEIQDVVHVAIGLHINGSLLGACDQTL